MPTSRRPRSTAECSRTHERPNHRTGYARPGHLNKILLRSLSEHNDRLLSDVYVACLRAGICGRLRPQSFRQHFDDLYEMQMPSLIAFLMNAGANSYEAADAAYEAFCVVLPDKWRTLEHPRAYLRKVAYRLYLRQAASRTSPCDPVPDRPGGRCPVVEVIASEERQMVLDALAQLSRAERQVMAYALDGFSHQETAAILGKTPVAVRKNYQRARASLISLLVSYEIWGISLRRPGWQRARQTGRRAC
ncbi:RNA polymerase sigma factor [Streptomyces sp. 147326]|uniref:RNA polymerase sigma factor n=1 Tax=Streptomyces sp. 147326 TaxID=3074379 RepID=UPI0038577583